MAILRPFQRDQKNDFAQGTGNAAIKSRLGQILGTDEGELLYDMEFGSKLHLLMHRGPSFDQETTNELARFYVLDAIRKFETGAKITKVTVVPLSAGNGEQIDVKFVPVDRQGNPIGVEDNVAIPLVSR